MRKTLPLLLLFTLFFPSAHAVPPKAKAFLIITGYGTAGGALLGFASMAFGNKPRAIAQGASLGLYAGLIFATYVVVSHEYKGGYNGGYEDADTLYYEDAEPQYQGDFFNAPGLGLSQTESLSLKFETKRSRGPVFQLPLLNIVF